MDIYKDLKVFPGNKIEHKNKHQTKCIRKRKNRKRKKWKKKDREKKEHGTRTKTTKNAIAIKESATWSMGIFFFHLSWFLSFSPQFTNFHSDMQSRGTREDG